MSRSEKEKMLSGELYDASDPELVGVRKQCRILLAKLNNDNRQDPKTVKATIKALIPNAPDSLTIEPPFACDYGSNITVGENVYFNFDCTVLDVAPVTIGNRVLCATKVQMITATHPIDAAERAEGLELGKPITIGNDVWIGSGAIILPGVTVGDRSVIGAGSVVTKNVPSDVVVAGNPAQVIRKLK